MHFNEVLVLQQISFKNPSNAQGLDKIQFQGVQDSSVNYVSYDVQRRHSSRSAKTEIQ